MKLPGSLFRVLKVDVSELQKEVNELTHEQWIEWELRQNKYKVHSATLSYPFYFTEYGEPSKSYNLDTKLWQLTKPIISEVEELYNRKAEISLLAKLLPFRNITPHTDGGLFTSTHRIHIPIVTDPRVLFIIDGKKYHMECGYAYEMNNLVEHSVVNPTNIGRVHLMVDLDPRKPLNHAIEKSPFKSIGYKSLEIKELA
jgi:hypothetical protein